MATLKFGFNSLLTPVTIYQRHVFGAVMSWDRTEGVLRFYMFGKLGFDLCAVPPDIYCP